MTANPKTLLNEIDLSEAEIKQKIQDYQTALEKIQIRKKHEAKLDKTPFKFIAGMSQEIFALAIEQMQKDKILNKKEVKTLTDYYNDFSPNATPKADDEPAPQSTSTSTAQNAPQGQAPAQHQHNTQNQHQQHP